MVENLRFLGEGSSATGKPGAKARPKGVVDAYDTAYAINMPIEEFYKTFGNQEKK